MKVVRALAAGATAAAAIRRRTGVETLATTRRPRRVARRAALLRETLACALLASVLMLPGCVAIQDEPDDMVALPVPSPSATPVSIASSEFQIIDIHEEPASSPSLIRVVGTIVNRSNREMTRVTVRVEARDVLGRALSRVTTPAMNDTVPPGGTTTFEVSMPRSPSIRDYFAEVIAQ